MTDRFQLKAIGEALYGTRWQSSLAADIDVTYRTIRRWLTGTRTIPASVWPLLATLVRARCIALEHSLNDIESKPTELSIALDIARDAHAGQLDQAGVDYIRHPLRLMHRVSGIQNKTAAMLHDVVEDSEYTFNDLLDAGIRPDVVTAVDALTRRSGESKEKAVTRARHNPIARIVKLADLEDNADLSRLSEPSQADRDRANRYHELQSILR